MKKLISFLILALLMIPVTSWSQVQKDMEFNFMMGSGTSNPSSINQYIDEINANAGTTSDLKKFSASSFFAAEFLYLPNTEFGIGFRYSVVASGVSEGVYSGEKIELIGGLVDYSLVLKLQTEPKKFQMGLGTTLGVATAVIGETQSGTTIAYSAPNQLVWRGLVTGRFNFGRFALFGEAGYLWAKSTEFKNGSTRLTVSNGSNVEMDLSGVYAALGMAFQF